MRRWSLVALGVALGACARPSGDARAPEPRSGSAVPADRTVAGPAPVLPPHVAMFAGLMPLKSTGVDTFRLARPAADGRGVVIAILDSGVDPGLPGLARTSTGQPKLLDLRDFSEEGRVSLRPIVPDANGGVTIDGVYVAGFGRVRRMSAGPFYGGLLREIELGVEAEADMNANGSMTDELPVVVAKSSQGWFVVTDTDGNGSLSDEDEIRDYLFGGDTFSYGTGPMTLAANLNEAADGTPELRFVFDNSGHGSHVAGIAAGSGLFGVDGFDGVAPGAQLLGLKIANNSRGGISVTGSMLRAMNYAADFAHRRSLPLVINLSFGVGNELEGSAAIDSLVDEFALKHPGVLFVISAGNDGPGISTLGFPGSAKYAVSVCALYPGAFARAPEPGLQTAPDRIGWWSARGGEVSKPDVCAPGIAFSNVPVWGTGKEISGGTSMAAPHVAGLAALLISGAAQEGRRVRAVDLKQALMASATRVPGGTMLDQGMGVPNTMQAYRWLLAAHQTGVYDVEALPDGGNASRGTAAYRRGGLQSDADTLQRFRFASVAGQPAVRLLLRPDAPWLRAPASVESRGGGGTITLTYDGTRLAQPGLHVGTVWAIPATDTMAGPSFAMTNTVIVPRKLDTPFAASAAVGPSGTHRFFFDVPRDAGGLLVELAVERDGRGTVFLFEPTGQPHRGGNETKATANQPARITVAAEDLVPGVYEAVVVGPPDDSVAYTLRARLPKASVEAIGPGLTALVRNVGPRVEAVTVSLRLVGAVTDRVVSGTAARPEEMRFTVPPWADRMTVDTELSPELWQQLTDFGVTVFDSAGHKIADGPLHYARGRQEVHLGRDRPAEVVVELFPGYAHLRPTGTWRARVRVAFHIGDPIELAARGSRGGNLVLSPDESRTVEVGPPANPFAIPAEYAYLLEVAVADEDGGVAVRRAGVTPDLLKAEEPRP